MLDIYYVYISLATREQTFVRSDIPAVCKVFIASHITDVDHKNSLRYPFDTRQWASDKDLRHLA